MPRTLISSVLKAHSPKNLVLTSAAILLMALPAIAMSKHECAFIWREADLNRDGVLNVYEEMSYLAMLRVENLTMGADGTLRDKLFPISCKTNLFSTGPIVQGAGLKTSRPITAWEPIATQLNPEVMEPQKEK